MPTLHIEHPITDFAVWKTAFDRFAQHRERAGVVGHRVQRPVDDTKYVVIDLDFTTQAEAEQFLSFLQTTVWSSSESSPALVGSPRTSMFELVDAAPAR